MKKKIVILLLLILALTWIISSKSGWCLDRWGRIILAPWEPLLSDFGPGNDPRNDRYKDPINIAIENSAFNIYSRGKSLSALSS